MKNESSIYLEGIVERNEGYHEKIRRLHFMSMQRISIQN